MDYFYKNSHYDELIYVQSGKGVFSSNFGDKILRKGFHSLNFSNGVVNGFPIKNIFVQN